MATRTVDNSEDVLDSRDIIARIEELADSLYDDDGNLTAGFDGEDRDEYEALRTLQEEAEGYSEDWKYGATLIRDSYFQTYAMELAEEIGAIPDDARWPATCIDWEQAARELRMDYTSVEFGGVTYWVR